MERTARGEPPANPTVAGGLPSYRSLHCCMTSKLPLSHPFSAHAEAVLDHYTRCFVRDGNVDHWGRHLMIRKRSQ